MRFITTLLCFLLAILQPVQAIPTPPIGLRPCCAFGYNLHAQVAGIPVPFFSVDNVIDVDALGGHHYNQGDQSLSTSLLGLSEEHNGLIFTKRAGFIDTAHVRDTADFTYYLFKLNLAQLGHEAQITLPTELRSRQIHWKNQSVSLDPKERVIRSAQAAAFIAFQLAQWHEIAQWFGLTYVSGFHEQASAFSPEDLYSNMLGANLARDVLLANPDANKQEFEKIFAHLLEDELRKLKAQPSSVTQQKIQQLEGIWWDSQRRLPDKWLLLKRDYHLAYALLPNEPTADHVLSLEESFHNDERIEDWVELKLISDQQDSYFNPLLKTVDMPDIWTAKQFHLFALFAKCQDTNAHPLKISPSVEPNGRATTSLCQTK
ncbi:DUF4056 domain-containing protein [Vibrio cholerae]